MVDQYEVMIKDKEKRSNFFSLINSIHPIFEKDKDTPLDNIWKFYDFPYGLEIQLQIANKLERVYYVPYLSAVQLYNNKGSLVFEFFETDRPDLRLQFPDKIDELSKAKKELKETLISDLDTELSWYSVVWSPILCNHLTMNSIKGEFLTYYQFEENGVFLAGVIPCKKIILETWFKSEKGTIRIPSLVANPGYFLTKHKIEHPDYIFFSKNNQIFK